MGARGDLMDDRMAGVDGEIDRAGNGRRCRIRAGQDEARQAIGERRLADAFRPLDQPGMVHASRTVGIEQCALRGRVAQQAIGTVRGGEPEGRGKVAAHAPCSARPAASMPKRRLTTSHTRSVTSSISPDASITTQRSGSAAAMSRKA